MVFFFNGLKAAVTISGSVAAAPPDYSATQTPVIAAQDSVGVTAVNTTATLYTVTGAKTFHLTSIFLQANQAPRYLKINDGNGGAIKFSYSQISGQTPLALSFPAPIQFSTSVFITADSNTDIRYSLVGFET